MQFDFSEDQRLLQETVRGFLESEAPVEWVRAQWQTETGRSAEFWKHFAEIGVSGLLVPEAHGGLGMDEIDGVLLLEEVGRAGLAEPVISTTVVGTPLLQELDAPELQSEWLPKVASGQALLAVSHPVNAFVEDAHVADLLLLIREDEIHAVLPGDVATTAQKSNDPARRIFSLDWEPSEASRLATGAHARKLASAALDRGALVCAAEALGAGQKLVDLAVAYAIQRKQFGVPIGSFQAVKHMLADVQVKIEYSRSLVYRAAHSVARDAATRSVDVSAAKLAACEAAGVAAKTSLQVHGAIGYTWEEDVHVWMRRAWSLELDWGRSSWHRARVASAVIDRESPALCFGYSAAGA